MFICVDKYVVISYSIFHDRKKKRFIKIKISIFRMTTYLFINKEERNEIFLWKVFFFQRWIRKKKKETRVCVSIIQVTYYLLSVFLDKRNTSCLFSFISTLPSIWLEREYRKTKCRCRVRLIITSFIVVLKPFASKLLFFFFFYVCVSAYMCRTRTIVT